MKNIYAALFGFLIWLFLLIPGNVSASSELIHSFDSQIIAHKDGSFDVTETIKYDFGQNQKHGIFRDIPTVARVGELYRQSKITITGIERDSRNENYSISENDNQISAKIGRADQTINGVHTYTISYNVQNGIGSNFKDHDEIYWNVTGNEWKVPILSASYSITTDFGVLPNQAVCYTGPQGSREKNCRHSPTPPFNPITTTLPLDPYQGLTVVAGFPVNTFPKSILTTKPPQDSSDITFSDNDSRWFGLLFFGSAALVNLVLTPALLFWYLKYKRKKRFGPVTVNFDIPKDNLGKRISPAEAGIIDNAKLERDDIVATIFDLAIRKYIKIEQIKKDKVLGVFGGGDDYNIVKLKGYDDVEEFEKTLLDRLFQNGDNIEISSLKKDFYQTFQDLEKDVFNSLVGKMYYTKNPKNQKALLLFAGFFSLFFLGFLLAPIFFFLS
ncbi:DUF2207 domain-containing protein [Candidatus Daviesbacteria bacterium]|nr:DUF2207 domain-containing protein [Candidatus Daviesbacteria bacterium]